MAANNVRVLKHGMTVQRFRTILNVELGIEAGDAVLVGKQTGANYVSLALDGDPEQGTDIFGGVTKSGSTATATADGVIDVELCVPGTIMECKANTPANIATDANLLGVLLDYVCFDRSAATAAGTLTLDENEGSDNDVHGFMILDGRITDGMLFFTPGNAWIGRGAV
jgi:hypothetical protein